MTTENQPATGQPPAPTTGNPAPVELDKLIKQWSDRFEKLKEEIGEKLGEANASFDGLKTQIAELAKNQADITAKLNNAINEIRVVGGRQLERANPEVPKAVEKKSRALTLIELADEE